MKDEWLHLSHRIARMRQTILTTQPEVCVERAVLTTKAYREHEQEQVVLKRGVFGKRSTGKYEHLY